MKFWIIYILVQISFFGGGTAVKNKKASYDPVYRHFQKHPPEMFYKKAVLFSSFLY